MADNEEKALNTKDSEEICDTFSCSPCLQAGKKEEAQKFCVECDQYVCNQCVQDHYKFLALRSHQILNKSEQEPCRRKADDRMETNLHLRRCSTHHGNIIDRFCKEHKELCCASCVTIKHRSCKHVQSLPSVAQDDYKNSSDYKESQEFIDNVMAKVKQEKANRKEHLDNLNREKEKLLQSVQTYENKIIDNIKIKVDSARQKILQAYGKFKASIELDVAALDTVISTSDTYSQTLSDDDAEKLFLSVQMGRMAAKEGEWLIAELPSESDWKKSMPFSINFELEQNVKHCELLTDSTADVEEACAFMDHMFILQKILKDCQCLSLQSLISMLHLYLQPLTLIQSGGKLEHDDSTTESSTCNRIKEKNESYLEITSRCNQCQNDSVYLKLIHYLSIPVKITPQGEYRLLQIFWIPVDRSERPVQFKLAVPKSGCISDLCYVLSSYVNVGCDAMIVADIYNHRFHRLFVMSEPLSQIMDRDDIYVYEIPVNDDPNKIFLPFYMTKENQQGSAGLGSKVTYWLFGQPLVVAVPKKCSYNKLYDILLQRLSRFVSTPEDSEVWWDANLTSKSEASACQERPRKIFNFLCVNSYGTPELDNKLNDDGMPLNLHSRMYISINWCAVAKAKFYDDTEAESFQIHESMKCERPENVIVIKRNIVEYLKRIAAEETSTRYCQTCKKEQPTTQKTNLRCLPNRLMTYLEAPLSETDQIFIDYLTGSLDLSKFVKYGTENCFYDLTAVINNDGQNYTCYCRNVKANTWYCLDKAGIRQSTKDEVKTEKSRVQLFQRRE